MSIEAPSGFASLTEPRPVLADLYFGGRKVGEASLTVRPNHIRFDNPEAVIALLPALDDPGRLVASLRQEFPSNAALICSPLKSEDCGHLSPEVAGVIFDEDRFRVDLFIHPDLLIAVSPVAKDYLQAPTGGPSLVSSVGLSLSGSSGNRTNYNIQNRSLLGLGGMRLRSDSSYSRGYGMVFDNLVAEVDQRNLRYSAGMFWAPGLDLIGQRRIIGAGVATQFDTRTDKDLLEGTPLYLFLERAARVDVLVDGRLLDSRAYEAGNNLIDTTSLPTGAYSLLLRIHEPGGRTREERRFFARNGQVAPQGKPIYFAYLGSLANTRRHHPISLSKTLFYQIGTAHRLSPKVALDAAVSGTQHRMIAQTGGYYLGSKLRMRAAALLSSQGDRGALVQVGTSGNGPLSLNADLRRVRSRRNAPLVPLSDFGESFSTVSATRASLGNTFTQLSGSLSYRIGQGYAGLTGAYRRDRGRQTQYSIGPSLSLPVMRRSGLQLSMQADAQHSRGSTALFAGLRLTATSRGGSMIGTAGYASLGRNGEGKRARAVGGIAGELYHQAGDLTEVNAMAAAERTIDESNVRFGGTLYSRYGVVRSDVLQRFGDRSGTQYGVNLQAGLAMSGNGAAFGGRELQQSALIASMVGDAPESEFDLLVNEVPKGRLRAGERLPVYLPAYRAYQIRLRPVSAASASFDTQARHVTLFPGTVANLKWTVAATYTVFGQATTVDGRPVSGARVTAPHGLGESDENGFFQIDVAAGDAITFTPQNGKICRVTLANNPPKSGYTALGKVLCQ